MNRTMVLIGLLALVPAAHADNLYIYDADTTRPLAVTVSRQLGIERVVSAPLPTRAAPIEIANPLGAPVLSGHMVTGHTLGAPVVGQIYGTGAYAGGMVVGPGVVAAPLEPLRHLGAPYVSANPMHVLQHEVHATALAWPRDGNTTFITSSGLSLR